jgi:hypothetical protein
MNFTSFILFEICLNEFKTGHAKWRSSTGEYRFSWINTLGRWIYKDWMHQIVLYLFG